MRVVICNQHLSTPLGLLKDELEARLFEGRQIINVLHTGNKKRCAPFPNVTLYSISIPHSFKVKYLSLTLDQTLIRAHPIRIKRLTLYNRLLMIKTIICNEKYTSIGIKLLMY